MLKGIHLTLMVGPAVPTAAPYEVMEALTSVQVTVPTVGAAAFDLVLLRCFNTAFRAAQSVHFPYLVPPDAISPGGQDEQDEEEAERGSAQDGGSLRRPP